MASRAINATADYLLQQISEQVNGPMLCQYERGR